jgi:uncharacterized protein YqhQ
VLRISVVVGFLQINQPDKNFLHVVQADGFIFIIIIIIIIITRVIINKLWTREIVERLLVLQLF